MIHLSPQTRISALIQDNKASIDAISTLAKPLEKLKNPLLRKLMANRITIEEAARMGGCTVEDFYRVLRPLGFTVADPETKDNAAAKNNFENNSDIASKLPGMMATQASVKPDWLIDLPAAKIHEFDVREMLASGHDPLKEIMQQFRQVPVGQVLCIINTFIPTPLVHLLAKNQALTYTEKSAEKCFYTYFLKLDKKKGQEEKQLNQEQQSRETAKTTLPKQSSAEKIQTLTAAEFATIKAKYPSDQTKEIDVRALEMPEPMHRILEALKVLPADHLLFVHHKRIPIYLLEQLEMEAGYQIFILPQSETAVKLMIMHT
ncbi:MAG TPA: DUF2249 domain-containing protein [Arachidicoccus sp.]|nr:DUF2249 domain-containing protein [Arachidicoccus sp.]